MKLFDKINKMIKEYKEKAPQRRRDRLEQLEHEAKTSQLKATIESNKAKQRKARAVGKGQSPIRFQLPVFSPPPQTTTKKKTKKRKIKKKTKKENDGFGPIRGF